MAEDQDKDSKTEEPTARRLSQSREKGQVPTSREVGTAFLFMAAVGLFYFFGQAMWLSMQSNMRFFLSGHINDDLTVPGLVLLIREVVASILWDLAPFFAVLVVMAVVSNLVQHGWLVSFEPIIPKLSKINPIAGLKRMFSMRSLVELIKSIVKMTVIGIAVWWAIEDGIDHILALAATSIHEVTYKMAADAMGMLWRVALAFIVLAIIDFAYQKYEYIKNLRMTLQEVKDEQKQTDGDPQVKGRIRQIQREMAQRRMMQEVPKADVVITNPTQYAIALVYRQNEMAAPKVVAKGRGPIAARIRELADENDVPLVENPPLARTLYSEVEIDQFIPADLFKAVAEVLAYVYRIKGGGAAGR